MTQGASLVLPFETTITKTNRISETESVSSGSHDQVFFVSIHLQKGLKQRVPDVKLSLGNGAFHSSQTNSLNINVPLRSASLVLEPGRPCYPGTRRSNPPLPETCSTLHPPQISAIWIRRTASLEPPVEDATVRPAHTSDTRRSFLFWKQSS